MIRMIYLNNAASSWPKAPGVPDLVRDSLSAPFEDPGRSSSDEQNPVEDCRRLLAKTLQIGDPSRIVLTPSATHALNLALHGLRGLGLKTVVTSVTEHNSVLRPLQLLKNRQGLEVIPIGLDRSGALDETAYDEALSGRPSLVVLNHASNVTGCVNDVSRLFEKAKRAGAWTLLDASQTLGHMPVHPLELHADLAAFTGHKGLLGPQGTGGLYVSPSLELEQVLVGGTGVRSDSMDHPADMPMRLEAGTFNTPALQGLAAALRWLEAHGEEHLQREAAVGRLLEAGLREIGAVRVFGDRSRPCLPGLISFTLQNWPVDEAGYILHRSFGIICRTGLHCAPLIHSAIGSAPQGTIRFSASGFNTEEESRYVLDAMRKISQ